MANISSTDEMIKQYSTEANLYVRIQTKRLFSTAKVGWADFLLQAYDLKPNYHVLELGCGNGIFWKAVSDKIPQNIKLILSDMSAGMLDAARNNTEGLGFINDYAVIDAQEIPFNDDTFDIVAANYMLYHIPDINAALSEISRVLKPNGLFFAATFGNDNLKEVDDILINFNENADPVANMINAVFGLENGEACLKKHFNSVKLKRYENSLHITDVKLLTEYLLSYRGMGNIGEILSEDKIPQFEMYIKELFSKKGYIDITQDEGLFISGNPI